MDVWHVGRAVERLRLERGWSQGQLAVRAGVSRSFVSKLEKGEREPTLKYLDKVASALRVSVAALSREGRSHERVDVDARIASINSHLLTMRELDAQEIEEVEAYVHMRVERMLQRKKEREDGQRSSQNA